MSSAPQPSPNNRGLLIRSTGEEEPLSLPSSVFSVSVRDVGVRYPFPLLVSAVDGFEFSTKRGPFTWNEGGIQMIGNALGLIEIAFRGTDPAIDSALRETHIIPIDPNNSLQHGHGRWLS